MELENSKTPHSYGATVVARSLEDLDDDAILAMLLWLGPRSVKRVGMTCRRLNQIVQTFTMSAPYVQTLCFSAMRHLTLRTHNTHRGCTAYVSAVTEGRMAEINVAVNNWVRKLAASLSKSSAPIVKWTKLEMLRFLYPITVHESASWVLAPFALEWCARSEFGLVWGVNKVRKEMLALLYKDSAARLRDLITTDTPVGWPMGITLATAIAALEPTIHKNTEVPIQRAVTKLIKHAFEQVSAEGQIVFTIACVANVRGIFTMDDAVRGWKALSRLQMTYNNISPITPKEDKFWLDTNLMLAKDAEKIPANNVNMFRCVEELKRTTPRDGGKEENSAGTGTGTGTGTTGTGTGTGTGTDTDEMMLKMLIHMLSPHASFIDLMAAGKPPGESNNNEEHDDDEPPGLEPRSTPSQTQDRRGP